MAASQARFLQLTARKSNIEYQGQQINQQRLALANESAGLFEQSMLISAPTPPSSLDDTFFTPGYTFMDKDSGVVKKILVGYSGGAADGVVMLYDLYLPDGSTQETVEVFVGAVESATVGGSASGVSHTVGKNSYESNLDTSAGTGLDLAVANIVFDEQTGRLASFDYGDAATLQSYDSGDITYSGEFNEEAYNQAMNEYEYEKSMYDYEIERINLETDQIQQQDKSLELRLRKLDTEHTAIQTEIDSVQKVIQKNIESTYKIFSS